MFILRLSRALSLVQLVLLSGVLTTPAHAALITRDDPVFGSGSLTFDTHTGLEWLDVSATRDTDFSQGGGLRTFNEMSSATRTPGSKYYGFSHASESMINQLLQNSGAFAPSQVLTYPRGQFATNPAAALQLKAQLGWVQEDYLAWTAIRDPDDFDRRTLFIGEFDSTGRVRVSQNEPSNQSGYLAYHLLARPAPSTPPPPPPIALDRAARLVTGSPTGIFQSVNTPGSPFELAFDTLFETTTGTLQAILANEILASIDAPGTLASGFSASSLLINQTDLLGLSGVDLKFVIDGPSQSSVLIDNISFPGLSNGDFESGDLSGWTVEASPGGSAGVVAVNVPAPQTGLLLLIGMALIARYRRVTAIRCLSHGF